MRVLLQGRLTGTLNKRIRDIRAMGGQERSRVEGWVVEVRRCRTSLEQVRSDRDETGTGERVGETEAVRYAYWGWVTTCLQLVLGKVNSKHVSQVQHRSTTGVWRIGARFGDVVCRYKVLCVSWARGSPGEAALTSIDDFFGANRLSGVRDNGRITANGAAAEGSRGQERGQKEETGQHHGRYSANLLRIQQPGVQRNAERSDEADRSLIF